MGTAIAEQPAYLSATEVAAVFRISRATAYRLAQIGELPSVRLGRSIRFPVEELEQVVASGKTRAAAQSTSGREASGLHVPRSAPASARPRTAEHVSAGARGEVHGEAA